MLRRQHILFLIGFLFLMTGEAAEITVSARFNPPKIALGDRAEYIVEIIQTDDQSRPSIEQVEHLPISATPGLQLSNGRNASSQQFQFENGRREYSLTHQLILDAKASNTGKYTIPSFTFAYKDQTLNVNAATLEVVERSADAAPSEGELIFLKTNTPKELYVGQTTQIELRLYIHEDVRVNGLNNFDRDATGFTISDLPKNSESTDLVNGRRYRVLTWPITITPIQTGELDLNFNFTITAQLPEANEPNLSRRDIFGRSIFDDFFKQRQRFNIYNEPTTVNVRPLPTEGQPKNFTGAIGDFAMEVSTDLEETGEGEPIMLSIKIAGTGNFERISGAYIEPSNSWRNYEPQASFSPNEDNPLRGAKRFDYVMIPESSGELELPEVSFTYFDPEAAKYVQLTAPPISITVSPSARVQRPSNTTETPSKPQNIAPDPVQRELSMEEALLTLDYSPKPVKLSDTEFWRNPIFWTIQALLAFMIGASYTWLRHRKRRMLDPAYADSLEAKKESQAAALQAKKSSTAHEFYKHAQVSIRAVLTHRSGKNLRSANIIELEAVCQQIGINETVSVEIKKLFNDADALRFSGSQQDSDLSVLRKGLERILKAL